MHHFQENFCNQTNQLIPIVSLLLTFSNSTNEVGGQLHTVGLVQLASTRLRQRWSRPHLQSRSSTGGWKE